MNAHGVTEQELSILLAKNDEVFQGSLETISYIPRAKKRRKTYYFFQKLFRFWRD